MKVLVVGSGGREHAIVWKLSQSKRIDKIFCAPGNGGISEYAECLDIGVMDTPSIINACREKNIDLVIVAPDDPLAMGMVNALTEAGIRAFGPTKEAALIESSKEFSKNLMKKYGIPTARFETFSDMDKALAYIENQEYPLLSRPTAWRSVKALLYAILKMKQGSHYQHDGKEKFGDAGNVVVIEEFLSGPEVSVLSFTDGKTIVPMVSAQDHKRVLTVIRALIPAGWAHSRQALCIPGK